MGFTFNPGGAVALASILYLVLSVVMGFVERYLKPPLWLSTLVFVPAHAASWCGWARATRRSSSWTPAPGAC